MARLSPLIHKHINMLRRYAFTLPDPVDKLTTPHVLICMHPM
jgi:hypothetical protein